MGSHRHRESCSPQVPGTQVQRNTEGHNARRQPSLRPTARKNNARDERLGRSPPHRQSVLMFAQINHRTKVFAQCLHTQNKQHK